jgi:uncharacterized membrane protein HdeD (DUF308 family)
MILTGGLGILFSIWVVLSPREGALGLVWLIGAYSVISGIFLTVLSFTLRGMQNQV